MNNLIYCIIVTFGTVIKPTTFLTKWNWNTTNDQVGRRGKIICDISINCRLGYFFRKQLLIAWFASQTANINKFFVNLTSFVGVCGFNIFNCRVVRLIFKQYMPVSNGTIVWQVNILNTQHFGSIKFPTCHIVSNIFINIFMPQLNIFPFIIAGKPLKTLNFLISKISHENWNFLIFTLITRNQGIKDCRQTFILN